MPYWLIEFIIKYSPIILTTLILAITWFAYERTKVKTKLEDYRFERNRNNVSNFRFRLKNLSHTTSATFKVRLQYKEKDRWKTLGTKRHRIRDVIKSVANKKYVKPHRHGSYPLYPQLPGTERGYPPWRVRIGPQDFRVFGSDPQPAHKTWAGNKLYRIYRTLQDSNREKEKDSWHDQTLVIQKNGGTFQFKIQDIFPKIEVPKKATDLKLIVEQTAEMFNFGKYKNGEWFYLGKSKGQVARNVLKKSMNVEDATWRSPFSFLYNQVRYKPSEYCRILRKKLEIWKS